MYRVALPVCIISVISTACYAIVPFQLLRQYPTGEDSTGIVFGDVDDDGDIDLITANRGSSNVSVLYNNGASVFSETVNFPTGGVPRYVDGGDFDGDGDYDLCTSDYGGMTMSVLMNDGQGAFGIASQYDMHVPAFHWVDDLDMDGHLDILTLHWDDKVEQPSLHPAIFTPLFNDGNGNFTYGSESWIGMQPRGGASADLDGDGIKDVVTANYISKTVSILMGLGKREWSDEIVIQLTGQPRYVLLDDYDADGDIDLAVLDKGDNHLWVFHNDGSANFTLEDTNDTSNIPHSMESGDVDNDGDSDIVVTHVGSAQQLLFLNDGTGHFPTVQVLIMASGPAEVQLADVNSDGKLDIVTANVNHQMKGASVLLQGSCYEGADCNNNGVSDYCELPDCNLNGFPDECDITSGISTDNDGNGVPDECQIDCNFNGIPDYYEIEQGLVGDCNENAIPDDCDWAVLADCDEDGLLDGCEIDDNGDFIPDDCQCIANFTGDSIVAVHDLLILIAAWGAEPLPHDDPWREDLNRDREINIHDLLILIGAWGECPVATLPNILGPCCINQSVCIEITETACYVRNGVYHGDEILCSDMNCTNP